MRTLPPVLAATKSLGRLLRDYLGMAARGRRSPIDDTDALRRFIETRASHVAQSALYGYLRTRAGLRYPELFADDVFVRSINIAKWHMWLACVSDLAVFAGGLISARAQAPREIVSPLMARVVGEVLEGAGFPQEAGDGFPEQVAGVHARLACCNWSAVADDTSCFVESPAALVRWAPIVEELKQLDDEIVRNSVRFRWHEVMRELRRNLDAAAIVAEPLV